MARANGSDLASLPRVPTLGAPGTISCCWRAAAGISTVALMGGNQCRLVSEKGSPATACLCSKHYARHGRLPRERELWGTPEWLEARVARWFALAEIPC